MAGMDFKSATEIKKETLALTVQRPVAVYPATVGMLALGYSTAFGFNLVSACVMAAGLAIGFGGWAIEYFVNGDKYGLDIVTRHRQAMEAQRKKTLRALAKDLKEGDSPEGVAQLGKLKQKFENFEAMLAKKLNPSELAYNRYLSMAEQVYLNALDNLERLATGIQSVSTIDIQGIEARLQDSSTSTQEMEALASRRSLWQSQQERARTLLVENEFAMTQIDHVTAKLAEITTKSGRAQVDMELAMSELKDLISRADRLTIAQ